MFIPEKAGRPAKITGLEKIGVLDSQLDELSVKTLRTVEGMHHGAIVSPIGDKTPIHQTHDQNPITGKGGIIFIHLTGLIIEQRPKRQGTIRGHQDIPPGTMGNALPFPLVVKFLNGHGKPVPR